MLKFLKMMVAEDVTITEEAGGGSLEEVSRREGSFAPRREGSGGGFRSEVQHQEKVVLDQEAHQLQEEKVVFQTDQEQKVHLIEHQDVQKTLVTHQDQEDQEETNV
jgi:hypothetical protein